MKQAALMAVMVLASVSAARAGDFCNGSELKTIDGENSSEVKDFCPSPTGDKNFFKKEEASYRDYSGCKNLPGKDYENSNFYCTGLARVGVPLRAKFDGSSFGSSNMDGFTCMSCSFKKAKFTPVELQKAILSSGDFTGADFSGRKVYSTPNTAPGAVHVSNLSGAILTTAKFNNANMIGVNFTGAELSGADFAGAQLQYAKFHDVNLSTAKNLEKAALKGATYNEKTVFPDTWDCAKVAALGLVFEPTKGVCLKSCEQGVLCGMIRDDAECQRAPKSAEECELLQADLANAKATLKGGAGSPGGKVAGGAGGTKSVAPKSAETPDGKKQPVDGTITKPVK